MTRTALITGAAAGVGRATALRMAQGGWHCVLVDANAQALDALAAAWPAGLPRPTTLAADLTDAARIARLAGEVPPLDALINNAGMSAGGADALADDVAAARLMALNLDAPARMVQACAPHLRTGARVVNVASGAGLRAIPWRGLYSASKAGLIAQTEALARARPDWTVTALAPGFVRTELVRQLIDLGRLDPKQAVAKVPLGRMAEPEDMAEALRFLADEGARPLTGQLLVLDGGSSVCGGSQAMPAALHAPLPFGMATAVRVECRAASPWHASLDAMASDGRMDDAAVSAHGEPRYGAVIDATPLDAAPGQCLDAVLHAARRFRAHHGAQASLTLLLPPGEADTPWALAGDAAATRMAIATLAAEWGAQALRINALQATAGTPPAACLPLLAYMAGARAQFLTGQLLRPGAM